MDTPKKIAILQHAPDYTEITRMLLEGRGYEVQPFDYGLDSISQVIEYAPDLLIMHFAPPLDQCWSLLTLLAADRDTARCPILVIGVTQNIVQQALAYGNVVQTLYGPFGTSDMERKINAAIGLGQWLRVRNPNVG